MKMSKFRHFFILYRQTYILSLDKKEKRAYTTSSCYANLERFQFLVFYTLKLSINDESRQNFNRNLHILAKYSARYCSYQAHPGLLILPASNHTKNRKSRNPWVYAWS